MPVTVEFIDALPERDNAEQLIGASVPDDWPDQELDGLLTLYAGWLRADASVLGYAAPATPEAVLALKCA